MGSGAPEDRAFDAFVHPYLPNAEPSVRSEMLRSLGVAEVDAFYADIPRDVRLDRPLRLPPAIRSEQELSAHVERLLAKNKTAGEVLSFLGGGCYQHYVPAVCDEVAGRSEFLTAYAGEPYEDHGRFQALWEYQSLMGSLLEMDVVNVPTYDGFQAAATALRMAGRITGRRELAIATPLGSEKLSKLADYVRPDHDLVVLAPSPQTGLIDLAGLRRSLSARVAAVYAETPTYFGVLDPSVPATVELAHEIGAVAIVGCDPLCLGAVAPPATYGADIVCGDLQPLGLHMDFGGTNGGFIATRQESRFVAELPSRLFGLVPTSEQGEYGFGDVAYERTSFAERERGKEWVGTAAALSGIVAGVYLALMGPTGMKEIAESILTRTCYAMNVLSRVPNLEVPMLSASHFREFVVNYEYSSVDEVNHQLLQQGIFGGARLNGEGGFGEQTSLFCITERHTKDDIDRLANTLIGILR